MLGNASGTPVKVYVGKQMVVKDQDVFSEAPGTTPKGDPCASQRILRATSRVKVGGLSVGTLGDVLNAGTNITIAKASAARVYA